MIFLFIFQDFYAVWAKIAEQGIAISVLALILIFVIILITKVLPTWKELRFRDADVRQKETESTVVLSSAVTHLADAQTTLANTMNEIRKRESEVSGKLADSVMSLAKAQTDFAAIIHDIAVEQRQSTETVKILQRVHAQSNEQLRADVQGLSETLQSIDVQEFTGTLQNLDRRMIRLENKDERVK